jgi:hypothetical protein
MDAVGHSRTFSGKPDLSAPKTPPQIGANPGLFSLRGENSVVSDLSALWLIVQLDLAAGRTLPRWPRTSDGVRFKLALVSSRLLSLLGAIWACFCSQCMMWYGSFYSGLRSRTLTVVLTSMILGTLLLPVFLRLSALACDTARSG